MCEEGQERIERVCFLPAIQSKGWLFFLEDLDQWVFLRDLLAMKG